jgi:hypothetical protein
MGKSYVISPAQQITYTVSATNENSSYPDDNLLDRDPQNPFKATTTATTITLSHASAAREVIAFINPSVLAGASTFTAGGVAVTCPARTADGQAVNPFRVLDLTAGTSTSVVISGASATVQIGELVLASAMTELNWTWGANAPGVTESYEWPERELRTFYQKSLIYDMGIRVRRAYGQLKRESDRATWLAIAQAAKGRAIPFVFIPDIDVNECWYVRLAESSLDALKRYQNATDVTIALEEVSNGLVL